MAQIRIAILQAMKILIITDNYLPSSISCAKLISDLAIEFVKQGHIPIVAVPDPKLKDASKISIEEGVTVLRIRTGRFKGANKFVRAINEIRLSSLIWKSGKSFFRENVCDLIVFYSPSIFFGKLVQRLKKMWNCKAYLILRDIFPQWAVDTGEIRKGLVYHFFKLVEKHQYDTADVIGVQSPANLNYFAGRRDAVKYQLEVLYNWSTLKERFIPDSNYRQNLRLQNKIVFFYGGNIGIAQGMDSIVRLAEKMHNHPQAYFLLVGQGSEVPRLNAEIANRALTNIAIHPAVSQKEYSAMLSEFDVGMIALDGNLKTHNFPGKMLGYMYFSKPILATINPKNDLSNILDGADAGLTCFAGDDEKFYEHALRLAEDRELRMRMGKNARILLENTFSSEKAASQIIISGA